MKDCFICFDSILHGISFNCKHEICIHCFMKLETNLCPYCRFPIYNIKITHYSTYIPPFLKNICKEKDIFTYVLLQIFHTNINFTLNELYNDIKKWSIPLYIKELYIKEIKILYNYIRPEKKQILILLFNLSFISCLARNIIIIIDNNPYTKKTLVFYPLFILINMVFLLYSIHIFYEKIQINNYNFNERKKIKIENIMI